MVVTKEDNGKGVGVVAAGNADARRRHGDKADEAAKL